MAHSKDLPFTIIDGSHQDDYDDPDGIDPLTTTFSDDSQAWSPNGQNIHHHNHEHHHHHNRDNAPSALRIRRHVPGSTDPTLQQLPPVVQAPPSSEISNVNVAIRRHQVEVPAEQNVVQPVFYPVPMPVYIQQPPVQLYPIQSNLDDRPIRPMADTSVYYDDSPPQQTSRKIKPIVPVKKHAPPSRPSPPSPDQYESESFELPPSRNHTTTVSPRRPIRTDLLPRTPFGIQSKARRPPQTEYVEVDPYDDDYDYQPPLPIPVPKKVVTYRSVPGMTTRERENYEMSPPTRVVYVRAPRVETITYRK